MVIVPLGGMPRVMSEVPAVSGRVPVPVAGRRVGGREGDEVPVEDDAPVAVWIALCRAEVSALLVLTSALWVAMPANPLPLFTISFPTEVMNELADVWDCDCSRALFQ